MASRGKARSVTPWGERILALLNHPPLSWLANEAGVGRSTLASIVHDVVPGADNHVARPWRPPSTNRDL